MDKVTLSQLLLDAQKMVNNAKELETISNSIFVEAESTNRQLESMRQFQEDLDALNKISRNNTNAEMVNRINLQNPSIREIRQENRELKACLEDHQRALEVIMQKYREHVQHKILNNQVNFKEQYNEHLLEIIREQTEKINEMAAVMQKAAIAYDEPFCKEIESINNLKLENKGLRELLQISKDFGSYNVPIVDMKFNVADHKEVQTETDLHETSSSSSNDSIIRPEKSTTSKSSSENEISSNEITTENISKLLELLPKKEERFESVVGVEADSSSEVGEEEDIDTESVNSDDSCATLMPLDDISSTCSEAVEELLNSICLIDANDANADDIVVGSPQIQNSNQNLNINNMLTSTPPLINSADADT